MDPHPIHALAIPPSADGGQDVDLSASSGGPCAVGRCSRRPTEADPEGFPPRRGRFGEAGARGPGQLEIRHQQV